MSKKVPNTATRALIRVLWTQPLWSILFAVFFGFLFGGTRTDFVQAYKLALLFAYVVGFTVWSIGLFLGHYRTPPPPRKMPLVAEIVTYVVGSMVASFVAALIAHFTILPGMLGSARSATLVGMFALLFGLLGTGLAYALHFYRQALDRARSEQELNMARRIQRGFLLTQFPSMPRLEVHALNVSSREVSGDFYDVVPAGDGAFLLAIADVSGKGVPAALLSSMLQASLRTQAPTVRSVGAILRSVNTLVHGSASPGQFATFFLARVEESTLRLDYSNAGHNYPILFRRDGSHVLLETGGTVVGVLPEATFEEGSIDLVPGDRVLFYTDGISEADNGTGELYGEERLMQAFRQLPPELNAHDTIERVLATLRAWLDDVEPGDDMTLMVLRVLD